jgi:hypothetical protein
MDGVVKAAAVITAVVMLPVSWLIWRSPDRPAIAQTQQAHRPGYVTIKTGGIACPSVQDVADIYRSDADMADVARFVAKHDCAVIQTGQSLPLVERGALASRIMVNGTVMYVRTIDLGD